MSLDSLWSAWLPALPSTLTHQPLARSKFPKIWLISPGRATPVCRSTMLMNATLRMLKKLITPMEPSLSSNTSVQGRKSKRESSLHSNSFKTHLLSSWSSSRAEKSSCAVPRDSLAKNDHQSPTNIHSFLYETILKLNWGHILQVYTHLSSLVWYSKKWLALRTKRCSSITKLSPKSRVAPLSWRRRSLCVRLSLRSF